MSPASGQKLLTGVAALRHRGPDAVLTTTGRAGLAALYGVVDGDVWLVGGAHPLLLTADYADRYEEPRAYPDLDHLARAPVVAPVRQAPRALVAGPSRSPPFPHPATCPAPLKHGRSRQPAPLHFAPPVP